MRNEETRKTNDHRKEKAEEAVRQGHELMELLEKYLDFPRWGFKVSLQDFSQRNRPKIIYDSELCRVRFSLSKKRLRMQDEFIIRYGRLHASDYSPSIFWQGEACLCWHNYRWKPIQFLDGLTPREAVDYEGWPPVAEAFKHSEEGKKLVADYWPKFTLRLHSILWEHYGERLFGLFDLQQPDLWKEFHHFVEEFFKLKNYKQAIGEPFPPLYKIC